MQESQEFHGIFQFLDVTEPSRAPRPEIPLPTDYVPQLGVEMPDLLSYYKRQPANHFDPELMKRQLFREGSSKCLDYFSNDLILNVNCLYYFESMEKALKLCEDNDLDLKSVLYLSNKETWLIII